MGMLEKFYRMEEATGIDLFIDAGGAFTINLSTVNRNGDMLDIAGAVHGLNAIEEVTKRLPSKSRVALNISGKGVLIKSLDKLAEINAETFHLVFPNADRDDFYIQHFISGDRSFVSVIRREEADRWITRFRTAGLEPLLLSMGPFPVSRVLSQLNFYGGELIFNGHQLVTDEGQNWLSARYQAGMQPAHPIKVGNEMIAGDTLLAYASGFQLLLSGQLEPVAADAEVLHDRLKKLQDYAKLKVYSFLILCVFCLLLCGNLFLLSWLLKDNDRLGDRAFISQKGVAETQVMQEHLQKQEYLLKQFGWDGGTDKALLIDRAAAMMPPGITWQAVAVNPLDVKASQREKSAVFREQQLLVSGSAPNVIPLNEWIARVRTMPWVKDIQLQDYAYSSEQNTGHFQVMIKY